MSLLIFFLFMLTKEICNNKHKIKPGAKLRIVLIADKKAQLIPSWGLKMASSQIVGTEWFF